MIHRWSRLLELEQFFVQPERRCLRIAEWQIRKDQRRSDMPLGHRPGCLETILPTLLLPIQIETIFNYITFL